MACLVFIIVFLISWFGTSRTNDYRERLFEDAGLTWMETWEGVIYFRHVYLVGSTMWRNKPKAVVVARTEKNKHNFTHVDVDHGNKTLVMSDAKTRSIMALTFDSIGTYTFWTLYRGTSSKVNEDLVCSSLIPVKSNLWIAGGIAVDWFTDVVYWTDAVYDVIYGASLSFNHAVKVIVDKLENPYGVATFPQKGFLFWTEVRGKKRPRLVRSSLGGRNIQLLKDFYDRIAYSLHIDYQQERLYWVYTRDAERGIQCSTLNGRIISTVNFAGFFMFDIDFFNEQLMYVERHGNTYQLAVRDKKSSKSVYNLTLDGTASGLRVMDPDRQYQVTNMCDMCPGVCTKSNHTVDCFCVEDLKATVDEKVVREYCGAEVFSGVLVNKAGGIFALPTNFAELSASSGASLAIPRVVVPSRSIVKAMTSDIGTNKIYFYEYQEQIIKSVRMEANAEPEIVSMAVSEVGGLAFDSIGRRLYWSDVTRAHIMVVGENGEYPIVLHEKLEKPHAIAVHPGRHYRYLFWSEETRRSSVWRSHLDGGVKETILTGLRIRGIKALAVDVQMNKLYICGSMKVYVLDLDGNNSRGIYFSKSLFTGITVLHDYIVLSDTSYHSSGLLALDKTRDDVTDGRPLVVSKATYPYFDYGNWYGVTYHHLSNQPRGTSLCKLRSQCEPGSLCLAGNRTVRCGCTLGYISDGSKCTLALPYRPYLLVADQRYRKLLQIRHSPRSYVAIPVKAVKQPFSIAYDPVRKFMSPNVERLGQVYWSDLESGTVSRSYMDGSYQEVIVHDPTAFITKLELDSDARLLYYLSRPRQPPQPDYYYATNLRSSLSVLNIDTGLTKTILDGALDEPSGIAVSESNGYVYIVEQNIIWRVTMDGSNLEPLIKNVRATTIALKDNYLYFTNVTEGRHMYDASYTHLLRADVNGSNVTRLLELSGLPGVTDVAVDNNLIYWTSTRTRGVQIVNVTGPYNVANVMPVDRLFKPTGLFVHVVDHIDSKCSKISCAGLCLGTTDGDVTCDYNVTQSYIEVRDTALCRIPEIVHGSVVDNEVHRVVPDGYEARVTCYAMHGISNEAPITCVNGTWSHIPHCSLEYDICGTIERGYKIYTESGHYFVYPEMTKVHVILIGGGGGGYDDINAEMSLSEKAGDGGGSSFGNFSVGGGTGGTATLGGRGGSGFSPGGHGSGPGNKACTTGGTAGQSLPAWEPGRPGKSLELFTGAGGYSDVCTTHHIDSATEKYSGPGGNEDGLYGGGAGAREGGTGGGGGWSRKTLTDLSPAQLIPVTVGRAGTPSYAPPGPGLVVVTWGDFQLDQYVEKYDVINACVLD